MVKDRYLELSAKFIEMGRALMTEGYDNKDFTISQAGASMIAMGGLMLDDKSMFLFSQMCGLFSAKMILETQERKKLDAETYEDFIKRINKMREDNGHKPLNEE